MNVLKVTLLADPNDAMDTRLMFHIEGEFDAFDGCAVESVEIGAGDKMEWQRSGGWISFGLRSGSARRGQGAGYLWSSNGETFEEETGIQTVGVCYEEIGPDGRRGPRMSLHMEAAVATELVKQLNLPVFMRRHRYGSYKFVVDSSRVATSRGDTCPICGHKCVFDRDIWGWKGCEHFVDVSYSSYLWMR